MIVASAPAREYDTPALRRSEPAPAALSPKQRKLQQRQVRTAENARAAKAVKAEKAAIAERADERVAPAAQRKPVLAPDGTVLFHPRLERDGITFKRANPLSNAAARGRKRTDAGMVATIRPEHERAADRLLTAWDTAGEGVRIGIANYGERSGGTPQSGYISSAVIEMVEFQRRAQIEIEAARTWLGGLWPVVHDVVLRGLDMAAWAEANRFDTKAAPGYVSAALDRLVEFYREPARSTASVLRSVAVTGPRQQA